MVEIRSATVGNPSRDFFLSGGIRAIAKLCFFTCWHWDHPRFLSIRRAIRNGPQPLNGKTFYNKKNLYADPSFINQMSLFWWVFGEIQDDLTGKRGSIILKTAG